MKSVGKIQASIYTGQLDLMCYHGWQICCAISYDVIV
jgi:hypothetical protein